MKGRKIALSKSIKGKRRKEMAYKKDAKRARMVASKGFKSRYARKRQYLDREGGWGWQYPGIKPWGGAC